MKSLLYYAGAALMLTGIGMLFAESICLIGIVPIVVGDALMTATS